MAETKLVQLVIFDGFQLLDLAGPADIFNAANTLSGKRLYEIAAVAAPAGPVRAMNGIEVNAATIGQPYRRVDTVLVTGGSVFDQAISNKDLIEGIRETAHDARRVGSMCAGTFLLAAAGLLHDRTVTTHWAGSTRLIEEYPDLHVEPDRIYVEDRGVWTSAGVTAGIDVAMALVTADQGPELAREISRWLVVYLHRPGGQSQFSVPVAAGPPRLEPIRALQIWIEENLADNLSLDALARRAGMSTRNFSRVFAAELGTTPARYVETVRVVAARRLLETTDYPLDRVAATVGLGRPESLYRVFQRHLGMAPGDYRERSAPPRPNPPEPLLPLTKPAR
ncbi:GlxA family transcriptional regulator [Nocardia brasiliensis]|uniref:GlxA family transcriptional regulator n=1 Tax=Nocardia brasiliensis TaxID=37326 RepID=UPI0037928389